MWLAAASAFSLYLILITGATVRLTGSGLGCDNWPGCQAGQPFPEKGYHSYIEFGNRLVGGITIALTLIAALGAFRVPTLPRSVRRLAVAVFVGTLAQAPLGYLTVRFHLNPYLVISHFLLSAVVLAAAVDRAAARARAPRTDVQSSSSRESSSTSSPSPRSLPSSCSSRGRSRPLPVRIRATRRR